MASWVGRALSDHLVPTSLLRVGLPTTRSAYPEPHPSWPWTPTGMGHPQLFWAALPAPRHTLIEKFAQHLILKPNFHALLRVRSNIFIRPEITGCVCYPLVLAGKNWRLSFWSRLSFRDSRITRIVTEDICCTGFSVTSTDSPVNYPLTVCIWNKS